LSHDRRETFTGPTTAAAMQLVTKDEAPVAARIVDVFLKDVLVRSYALDWDIVHTPLFDQDFIDRARERLKADGYTAQQIAEARFVVRD
jgi:hypothetical protein